MWWLLKREPSGHPRLMSPTLLMNFMDISLMINWIFHIGEIYNIFVSAFSLCSFAKTNEKTLPLLKAVYEFAVILSKLLIL